MEPIVVIVVVAAVVLVMILIRKNARDRRQYERYLNDVDKTRDDSDEPNDPE